MVYKRHSNNLCDCLSRVKEDKIFLQSKRGTNHVAKWLQCPPHDREVVGSNPGQVIPAGPHVRTGLANRATLSKEDVNK